MKQHESRLLISFHDLGLGGIQKKTVDIIHYVQATQSQTTVRLCLRRKEGLFLSQIPNNVVVTASKFHFYRLGIIWYIIWTIKEILIFNPTHILTFMDFSAVPTFIALKVLFWKHPQITIGEDILTSKYLTDVYSNKQAIIRRKLIKKYYPKANKILVQTPVQKKDLEDILQLRNSSKIVVSPNWLPLNYPPAVSKKITRDIDILFIGRLAIQKNIPKFINIVCEIKKTNPSIKAVIVGSGTEKDNLQLLIDQLKLKPNIKIVSQTNDPQSFYLRSKIFLLTSDYEGFPLTLMEAIACGCFPVCHNLPEIKLFFEKYSSEVLFDTSRQAVKIINHMFPRPNQKIITHYQQKLFLLQQKNIQQYLKHCLST